MKAITLRDGDEVVGMSTLRPDAYVLTVSETGFGRLSEIGDYRLQTRGGKGITNYHVKKYGDVAAIKVVDLEDDIIIISDDGIIIRIQADSIRLCARPSKGVVVMKVKDGSKVVTLARAPHEEEEEPEAEEIEGAAETTEPDEPEQAPEEQES